MAEQPTECAGLVALVSGVPRDGLYPVRADVPDNAAVRVD